MTVTQEQDIEESLEEIPGSVSINIDSKLYESKAEHDYELQNEFLILDNLMDEKQIGLLHDPVELGKSLKQ